MTAHDRRSGSERRSIDRYAVDVEIEWENSAGERNPGSLSDISYEGCFVLTSGDVKDDEPVRIFIPLADGMKVQFAGRIANHVFEIGFGVQFDPLSAAQREMLGNLLKKFGHS